MRISLASFLSCSFTFQLQATSRPTTSRITTDAHPLTGKPLASLVPLPHAGELLLVFAQVAVCR